MRDVSFLWDLDGVLTDTSHMHKIAWITILSEYVPDCSHAWLEDQFIRCFSGVPRIVGIKRFLANSSVRLASDLDLEKIADEIASKKNTYFKSMLELNNKVTVFPDSFRFIKWANSAGYLNGLASQSENAELVVSLSGLKDSLNAMATGNTAKLHNVNPKPSKDFYNHAASILGVNISQCIVFEDTYAGALSAVTAGVMTCVGVARQSESVMELTAAGCDIIIKSFDQLNTFIRLKGSE